ncbi:MAG TPA: dienelactone hydrolase family protein [Gemmatimonadaceae bacterium]|nr:dienelactone hydrolase family protein [Gemmatimonadaceae bacterium]
MSHRSLSIVAALLAPLAAARAQAVPLPSEHAGHAMTMPAPVTAVVADTMLPPSATDAAARLAASPRHREWVMIPAGNGDSVGAWVIYPERRTKAPVVLVVHEIFGLSTWVKAVGDQLAAQGFIAIVPDLLTGKRVPMNGPDSISIDSAIVLIRTLKPEDVQRRLVAAAAYGMKLPAALPKYGIVGFCWGGGVSFAHAALGPAVSASVVFYGVSPDSSLIGMVHAPVLGLYGGDDARVDATIPGADSVLQRLGRTYDHFVFAGAGHGFARDQAGRNGANYAAIQQAWPKTIAWFRKYLEP